MQASKIQSVEEIFTRFLVDFPEFSSGILASGVPVRDFTDPKISDVDITMIGKVSFETEQRLVESGWSVKREISRTILGLKDRYSRPLNVYVTMDRRLAFRAITHRMHELLLTKLRPDLVFLVVEYKRRGSSTESAWVKVLNIKCDDPYEAMLNWEKIKSALDSTE